MSADDGAFVPLAVTLRGSVAVSPPQTPVPVPVSAVARDPEELAAVLRDVRFFRAHLMDAYDAARATLVRDLAYAVLGRELVLAPADVATLAARIVAEHPATQPLRVRVAPADAAVRCGDLPVVVDPALAAGDAVVEFAGGSVDARLGVRLASVLAAWT
jgi:flagellar biosynthesis/type III secretory pathway protein FliH